jgi:hypothetical protein
MLLIWIYILSNQSLLPHNFVQMPVLATIKVSLQSHVLCLDAPGMPQLQVPISPDAYLSLSTVTVESAGVSASGPWSLASLDCKQHKEGSTWISKYLNQKAEKGSGRLVNGKMTPGNFALVRS